MQADKVLKKLKYWGWRVFVFYVAAGALLFFMQDLLLFRPRKLASDYQYHFDQPFRQIDLPVRADKNLSLVQFTVPDSLRKGIVLYFHGNRGNINRYAPFAKHFTRNNYEVWMIDYPGYGKSTGSRSEKILYEDAHLFYKMALQKVAADSIILYGKSLGSGIAAELASSVSCKKLILECPYYSMPRLASHYFFIYPVSYFMKYQLPTYQYLETVHAPVTILHGKSDWVVPFKHAVWLKEHKPDIDLFAVEKGSHNDLAEFPEFQKKLDELLK